MTADREFLKRLEYSSSEDEFLEFDDSKEIYVNLNRRKSKMGKLSTETPVKDRGSKRKSFPDAKVEEKGKDRRRTRSSTSKSKTKESSLLQEARKPPAIQPTSFITTRRLTAGISGIFSNSKASNVVKRPGRRRAMDFSKRKIPMEVQAQVERGLERIIHQPSFVIQDSVVMNSSEDEAQGPSPSVCEKSPGNLHSNNRMVSSSSSATSHTFPIVITPHTRLSAEVPLEEISGRLKDSLIISDFFPGKSYLEELKEDLRKSTKQHVSILKNDDSRTATETPAVCRTGVVPISVSWRTRMMSTKVSSDCKSLHQADPKLNDTFDTSMVTSGKGNNIAMAELNPTSISGHASHSDCMHPNQFCSTSRYDDNHADKPMDTRVCTISQVLPGYDMAQCSSRPRLAEIENQECHQRVQVTETQANGLLCHPRMPGMVRRTEDERSLSNTRAFDQGEFYQQMDLNQYCNQLQAQQQINLHHQNSGVFSFEAARHGQRIRNNNMNSFDASSHNFKSYKSHLYPRRQGTLQNDTGFASIESSYNRYIDHTYATNSDNYDILHYAGEMNDGDGKMDDIDTNDERTKAFSSCLNLPKKPCVDSPASSFKLYRRKMF